MCRHTYTWIHVNIHIEFVTLFCLVSEMPFPSLELILNKNLGFYLCLNLFYLCCVIQSSYGFPVARLSKGLDFEEVDEVMAAARG